MQSVYKFIFFFPETSLFLAMLLVGGRCRLYLRMDVFVCAGLDHLSYMLTLEKSKVLQRSK